MGRGLRLVAAAVMLLGLSGCNMVVSEEPWFAEADGQPAPRLREGLWLRAAQGCRVDQDKPAERWPDCAEASFVRGDERWAMQWSDSDEQGRGRRTFAGWEQVDWPPDALFVANGDHVIVQARVQGDGDAPPDPADGDGASSLYMYGAIRLLGKDEQGRVTATEAWTVQCGPLPRPRSTRRRRADADQTASPEDRVTDRPFPGLTVVENDCVAESADAVRRAAMLSEALEPPARDRWIRDGWR